MLNKVAQPFVIFVQRYYPDPFLFATLLTIVVFLMAIGLTPAGPMDAVMEWGGGFHVLMTFIGQLSLTLIAAHALAHTRPVRKLLDAIGGIPNTPAQAYALTCFIAGVASLFAWAFGLVVGALVARRVAMAGQAKGLKIHYPGLVAAGYSGFVLWHMGYSSSAALFVATPGHVFEDIMGIVHVSETLLQPYNIGAALLLLITLPILMILIMPRREHDILELPQHVIDEAKRQEEQDAARERVSLADLTPGQRIERWRWVNVLMGAGLWLFLISHWMGAGFELTLDLVNWSFLGLGLLLARSPIEYVELIRNASGTVGQIILQYPFYAGIMGIMAGTGLVTVIAEWFIAISSQVSLSFFAFLSAGILNVFIPSGGGQWSVQGAIFLEAANQLNVAHSSIVMAIAWGDQWTNMIQPFWTIPILAIAGLNVRHVMGYTFMTLIWSGIVFSAFLLLFAH